MKPIPAAAIEDAKRNIRRRAQNPLERDSPPADTLAFQLLNTSAPLFEREFRITSTRRFRADFFFPLARLVVEVDGGAWVNGRHSRGAGVESDCEKSALIASMPARLLRVTPKQIKSGQALTWIQQAIGI